VATTRDVADGPNAAAEAAAAPRPSETRAVIGEADKPVATPERTSFLIPTPLSREGGGAIPEPQKWGLIRAFGEAVRADRGDDRRPPHVDALLRGDNAVTIRAVCEATVAGRRGKAVPRAPAGTRTGDVSCKG
jgi:hypothetical protein